jgi:hypothetical protein
LRLFFKKAVLAFSPTLPHLGGAGRSAFGDSLVYLANAGFEAGSLTIFPGFWTIT